MREKEKEKLYQYYFNKELRLMDDIVTYENRYRVRDCDELDHLESIISIVRKKMFDEVMFDVFRLLNISTYQSYINEKDRRE